MVQWQEVSAVYLNGAVMSIDNSEPSGPCEKARFAQRLVFCLLGGAPIIGTILLSISPILVVPYLVLFMASGVYLMTVRCPRCGEAYFYTGFVWVPCAQRCCRCGKP
jgi:hypothetical protein